MLIISDFRKKDNNLTNKEYNAFKELAKNKNVIVTKADEGNAMVIMNKQVYVYLLRFIIKEHFLVKNDTFSAINQRD